MTANLTGLIHQTIERDAIVRQGISRGLITPRSLAAYLMKTNPGGDLSFEALRTAIRRSQKEFSDKAETLNRKNEFFRDARLHLKSGIVKVAFQKGDASLELINKSFKAMEIYGGDTFRVTKGQNILHILVDESNLQKIKDLFSERVLNIESGLCELTTELPLSAYRVPGMFAALVNEFSINEINIVEAFSCGTEINIFVQESDSQQAFNVIKDMIERSRKESEKNEKAKKAA